jgi:prepilin-type N-terminal cleavage/methylation domain-containing protein
MRAFAGFSVVIEIPAVNLHQHLLFMKNTSQSRATAPAFTLVELLTVIAIIAILMGLLFPAIGIIKEQARKVQAKNDVTNIVAAVKQYYTEYGKYPPVMDPPAPSGNDDLVGDPKAQATVNNNALFNTLRSIPDGLNANHKFNPRRIVFFEGKSAADVNAPRAGFSDKSSDPLTKGNYFDPWGKQYNIVMDSNYDNVLLLDNQYTDFSSTDAPRVGVGAFSMGKDNTLGTAGDKTYKKGSTTSDDVISWQ